MKNTVFTALFGALLGGAASAPAAAQSSPAAPPDTARFARHEWGLMASPVLDKFFTANRSLPVGLLYKHQTRAGRATRYGLVLHYDHDSRIFDNPPTPNEDRTFTDYGAGLYTGREYSRPLARRWVGTAGFDVGLGFDRNVSTKTSYYDLGGVQVSDLYYLRYNRYSGQLRAFAGLRYYVRPWLYVSAETALQLFFQRSKVAAERVLTTVATGGTYGCAEGGWTEDVRQLRLQPVQQITLHYTFPTL